MTLWSFTAKELRTRPGRATLTILSIVISVAAIVSVNLSTSAARSAYRQMFEKMTGKADLEILHEAGAPFDDTEFMPKFDKRLADPNDPLYRHIKYAVSIVRKGTVFYPSAESDIRAKIAVLGIDPEKDANVRDYELVDGAFLSYLPGGAEAAVGPAFQLMVGRDEVLVDAGLAKNMGVKVGDSVKIAKKSKGLHSLKVVGLVRLTSSPAVAGGGLYLSLRDAQRTLGKRGEIDAVQIVLKEANHDEKAATKALTEFPLPKGLEVRVPDSRSQRAEENMLQTEQGLNLAILLTLILAVCIVLNTFFMNVTERRRQFAVMRAIGATRKQIMRLLLGEGLLLGVIGTSVGIVCGVGGAMLLTRAMGNLMQVELQAVQLNPIILILGGVFGIGLSLIGTYFPARRAGKLSPLEGMSTVAVEDREHFPWVITNLSLVAVVLSQGVIAACIAGYIPTNYSIPAAGVSLFACVFLIGTILHPMSNFVFAVLRPIIGVEGRLAHQQLLRRRGRSALTIAVLFVAVVFGVGFGTTIINNTQNVKNWFEETITGDFFIRLSMPDLTINASTDMPESLGDEIRAIDGITDAVPVKLANVRIDDQIVTLMAREFRPDERLPLALHGNVDYEEIKQRLFDGEVVVSTVLTQRMKLKPGDEIAIKTKDGPQTFRVAAEGNEYVAGGLVVQMDYGVARRELGVEGVDAFAIYADQKKVDAAAEELEALRAKYGLTLQTRADFRRIVNGMMSGVVGALWALLVLGFIVAAFGIVNTLTMNVLEQTRELGLLRVIAMTRRQARKTIVSQAALMGLIALLPGVAIGLLMAYLMNMSTLPTTGHHVRFDLHPALILGCSVGSLVIVLVASWLPGERAARIKLAEALQYE